jgi:hypothetical protein
MTVACYLDRRAGPAELMKLFAQGCNGKLVNEPALDEAATDHAVAAKGIAERLVPKLRRASLPFWYIDTAYIQMPRRREYRIERGRGWPPENMGDYSMSRALDMGIELQPWRETGEHVLLCFPGPGSGKDFELGIDQWAATIRGRIEEQTDREILPREKYMRFGRPLAEDLRSAWCLVTHSSTAAVEAVISGVPVFVAPTNPAAPVGRTDLDIENPVRPDREKWLAALAWRQFDRQEIRSGMAWAHVNARKE